MKCVLCYVMFYVIKILGKKELAITAGMSFKTALAADFKKEYKT